MNPHVPVRPVPAPRSAGARHGVPDEPDTEVLRLDALRAGARQVGAQRVEARPVAADPVPRQEQRRPRLPLPTWDPLPPAAV